ncbi:unnamed protein product [Anisakis simplex]|uniref:Uncharacterized protein n=1 Tax=Anisakis simplex TaxID=6269 RepID=A0A0M3JIL6_ANISI|nr:unnamed protein product [Anisakis simplex]
MASTATATALYGCQQPGQQQQGGRRTVASVPHSAALYPKRSASANVTHSASALRLQERRLHEQETIDELLQKCRTSQRGLACSSTQQVRYYYYYCYILLLYIVIMYYYILLLCIIIIYCYYVLLLLRLLTNSIVLND